jgi:hypothetical protein
VISVFRDDPFEAELAGVLKDDLGVALDVLVVLDARPVRSSRRRG